MALNVKVGLIGPFDMLKFKNMAKTREKAIEAASANEIVADYAINRNAKALHPDYLSLVVAEILDHGKAGAKTFVFKNANGGSLPYFRAGQYLSLKLALDGSRVSRPYSISSGPKEALEGRLANGPRQSRRLCCRPHSCRSEGWRCGHRLSARGTFLL